MQRFKNDLDQVIYLHSKIEKIIDSYLDQHKDKKISLSLIKNHVLFELNTQPENWLSVEKRVISYIEDNSCTSSNSDINKKYCLYGNSFIKQWNK